MFSYTSAATPTLILPQSRFLSEGACHHQPRHANQPPPPKQKNTTPGRRTLDTVENKIVDSEERLLVPKTGVGECDLNPALFAVYKANAEQLEQRYKVPGSNHARTASFVSVTKYLDSRRSRVGLDFCNTDGQKYGSLSLHSRKKYHRGKSMMPILYCRGASPPRSGFSSFDSPVTTRVPKQATRARTSLDEAILKP